MESFCEIFAWNCVECSWFFLLSTTKTPAQQKDLFLLLFYPSGGLSCLIFANCSKSSIIHGNGLPSFVLHTEFWFLVEFHKYFHSCQANAFAKNNNNGMLLRFGRRKYNLAYSNCIDPIKLFISRGKKTTVEDLTLPYLALVLLQL